MIKATEFIKPRYYMISHEAFDRPLQEHILKNLGEDPLNDFLVETMGGKVGAALLDYTWEKFKTKEEERLIEGEYSGVVFDLERISSEYRIEPEAITVVLDMLSRFREPLIMVSRGYILINRDLYYGRTLYICLKNFHLRLKAEFDDTTWSDDDVKPTSVPEDDDFLRRCALPDLKEWLVSDKI